MEEQIPEIGSKYLVTWIVNSNGKSKKLTRVMYVVQGGDDDTLIIMRTDRYNIEPYTRIECITDLDDPPRKEEIEILAYPSEFPVYNNSNPIEGRVSMVIFQKLDS